MNTLKLEVNKRDLGNRADACEEALSTALKRILFLSWSDFWKSPYKDFLSCRLSIVTWLQEMFWLVKERNVRWQILEWQGMCIKKTSTTKRVAWVQLSTPFNFKACRVLSQEICSQGFKLLLWNLEYAQRRLKSCWEGKNNQNIGIRAEIKF